MIAGHIHDALAQVQELRNKILEKQRFKGYSGRARALSGTLAFITAAVLTWTPVPAGNSSHLIAWSLVFLVSISLNFGAIFYWFLLHPRSGRDLRRLRPVIDVLPPLAVGGILTLALLRAERLDYLPGMWMALFGLSNLAGRHSLPPSILWVGIYYIAAGAAVLLWLPSFLNPWPMGFVFLLGEWAGGTILHFDEEERLPLPHFLHREICHAKNRKSV